jgi:exosome complex exonuclease RRP6
MEDVDQVNEADKHASALTGDHTYVPLSARVPKQAQATLDAASTTPIAPAPSDKDVIVVSTMADKPKKRRRNVAATTAATGAATGLDSSSSAVSPAKKKKVDKDKIKKANVKSEPVDPHDYSTSKSILDAEPQSGLGDDAAGGKKKKRKDQVGRAAKGFTIDTSAFRREPRVNNAPKKGAISKTFV